MNSNTPLALQPPTAHVTIRPVRLSDAASLHRDCWPERNFEAVYRFVSRAHYNTVQGRVMAIVATGTGDSILGYGQFTHWPRCGEISDLMVAESQRSKGIGTAIIQYLVRAARDMDSECVDIGVALSNPRALALYRRLGFRDSHSENLDLGHGSEAVLYLRLKFPK
jgi:ribosomal protein S18 acetylase RimI-like enzyme